jgi:hypothetical protein
MDLSCSKCPTEQRPILAVFLSMACSGRREGISSPRRCLLLPLHASDCGEHASQAVPSPHGFRLQAAIIVVWRLKPLSCPSLQPSPEQATTSTWIESTRKSLNGSTVNNQSTLLKSGHLIGPPMGPACPPLRKCCPVISVTPASSAASSPRQTAQIRLRGSALSERSGLGLAGLGAP